MAGGVLLLVVGLGEGVLLLGGDLCVLELLLGGVLSGDLSLVLCTESLLELEYTEEDLALFLPLSAGL